MCMSTDDLHEDEKPESGKPGEFILLSLSVYSVICVCCCLSLFYAPTKDGQRLVFTGLPSGCLSMHCLPVNSYSAWHNFSSVCGLILMRLGTNDLHIIGHCWKGFQCQRSKVKVTTRLDALLLWRCTFWWYDAEADLLTQLMMFLTALYCIWYASTKHYCVLLAYLLW